MPGRTFHIEDIQDQVELALMRSEHHKVARAYVLYREERARERAKAAPAAETATPHRASAAHEDRRRCAGAARRGAPGGRGRRGLRRPRGRVRRNRSSTETRRNLYDGISLDELALAPILAARTLIETEPNYAKASARLLLDKLRREALTFVAGRPEQATQAEMASALCRIFPRLYQGRHRRRTARPGAGALRPRAALPPR